ncbi:MAG TPA: competence/damage-inducible protein A [Nitrospirota bacterium]|nr:competence/damage-inducible protein A [Nitrospirota bacterium]
MRAEIIATGTELLTGGSLDTNSVFLSEELMLVGLETAFKTVVGDDEKNMEEVLKRALERVDAVIITGGLGPTEDDITRKVIAKITKKRLILNEDALKAVHARLAGRGREVVIPNERQALIPAGARLLQNPAGTAPGFYIDEEGVFLAVLPGVPREMRAMYSEGLRPALEHRFGGKSFIRRRVLRTCGMSESAVNQAIQDIMRRGDPVVGLSVKGTGVDIRIIARGSTAENSQALTDRTESAIREKLGDAVYGVDGVEMEEVVGALLKQRRLTLAVAESCTGGLIGARITNIAGSSEYFERAAVVYSNLAKTEMLGVPADIIERRGAVSGEVAAAMAEGIRQAAHTALGLSVTGIAGPEGGTEKKPVGLVYTALASSQGVKTLEHHFLGNREQIRLRASQMALDMVRRHLIG